ncbi:hypothetical protein [Mucilaginibacter celer]|uniref:PA14 domain-containing protein n=1 Tax=Mucilaginibacter celer TaxID=2305508 RepID=A0A494VLT1_9SPHI|nr:hypothetical protein [Mucilaginibacter celer]AYL93830.1 hypothetical protein HYN43_000305 [Mucilaginibacter celer]
MSHIFKQKRKIAVVLILIWGFNVFVPAVSYALTTGPAQPETQAFQPAEVSNMVDLQTGDFNYNIPLLDVGGYPINLSYQSGATGIDDEASWVGLGWSLNPGAINRQLRGIPDDFSGDDDKMETVHYTKPKVTVGGKVTGKAEFFGKAANGSLTFGIFNDNYTGFGAEIGANAGLSFSFANSGNLTGGLGIGVLSNTQSGVDVSVSPYVSLSVQAKAVKGLTTNAGLSASLGYNTRSGLKNLAFSGSFGATATGYRLKTKYLGQGVTQTRIVPESASQNFSFFGSNISFNTEPISPTINVPYFSDYTSFSIDVGPAAVGGFVSLGGTGYQNVRSVKDIQSFKPAYGFLYAERGKNNKDAVMDFIREKDNPIIPEIPNLAIPIHTPDLWSFTNQLGSGQFRLYRNGSGIFFDNYESDESKIGTIGADYGGGQYFHGGFTYFDQNGHTTTQKWVKENQYMNIGDFQNEPNDPGSEHAYFKLIGEKNPENKKLKDNVGDTKPLKVKMMVNASQAVAQAAYTDPSVSPVNIGNTKRQNRRTMISYLTAAEAKLGGLDRDIPVYQQNTISGNVYSASPQPASVIVRVDPSQTLPVRKKNHISEVTVTDPEGKRMVYGVPVYNTKQTEYTFAVGRVAQKNGGDYTPNINKVATPSLGDPKGITGGIDNYYHKENTPAYATSYLLSGILSPDYVDVLGDGITPDDLGTAVKFNYSMLPKYYKWTSSFNGAVLNKGLLADPDDDKGSIITGEKELWYVSSIETKTHIAYFITQNRTDGLGVSDEFGGAKDPGSPQKSLKEIRLYSKNDMSKPIKTVKFCYTNELCPNIPNSANGSGKLTLKQVWFEYGNSDKGASHPYVFNYNTTSSTGETVEYGNMTLKKAPYIGQAAGDMVTDRWGNYKLYKNNPASMGNDAYPYSLQDRSIADMDASLWHLNKISLPTGGEINVFYEASDYAFVQDKRAMVMSSANLITAPASGNTTDNLLKAKGVQINIGTTIAPAITDDPTAWFKKNFLNGNNYLYTKFRVRISTDYSEGPHLSPYKDCDYDYVPVYCEISNVTIDSNGNAYVMFKDITEGNVTANPIMIATWQRLKNEYPRFAYPGFDRRNKNASSSIASVVAAVVAAVSNFSELTGSFYEKAYRKAQDKFFANEIKLSDSFVKIVKIDGKKLGGPARVKRVQLVDNWDTMTGGAAQLAGQYGQSYDYTTTLNGSTISSGVATYEPAIGNDENALKTAVPYIQKIKGAINNYFNLEEPFVESLYPAPAIGYSKVTVRDVDQTGAILPQRGYSVHEFFTAKDFPVKVTALPIDPYPYKDHATFGLVTSNSVDKIALSQGYSIELNDMHGKPRTERTFNAAGSELASTEYHFATDDKEVNLDNNVTVLDKNGAASNQIIGRDIEYFSDFREQEEVNSGRTVNLGVDVIPFFIPPVLPIPHFPTGTNNSYSLFRSAVTLKVIQTYGIMERVVKKIDGSTITTENEAYDITTGEPIITRTNNEYKKNIYTASMPAYWAYPGMGGAYANANAVFQKLSVDANGLVTTSGALQYLNIGDELLDITEGETTTKHYWVIEDQASPGSNSRRLITAGGALATAFTDRKLKVIRSGLRNMLNASAASYTSLNDPIVGNMLNIRSNGDLTGMAVLNASATTFNSTWPTWVPCESVTNIDYKDHGSPTPVFTDEEFKIRAAYPHSFHGSNGTYYLDQPEQVVSNDYFKGRLDKVGVWINKYHYETNPIGFTAKFHVDESKVYYVGYSADDTYTIYFDGNPVEKSMPHLASGNELRYWMIKAIPLEAGDHTIYASATNLPSSSDETLNPGSIGLEVYNNTLGELKALPVNNTTGPNCLFSTKKWRDVAPQDQPDKAPKDQVDNRNTFISNGIRVYYNYDTRSFFNPFTAGVLGNWRPYQNKVFLQKRAYPKPANANTAANIKNAGYIDKFYSFWYFDGVKWVLNSVTGASRWVTGNTMTAYDRYGQELENKDALNRYSSAIYGFAGSLPAAVASNAKSRELFSQTFEDYPWGIGRDRYYSSCNSGQLIVNGGAISQYISHTGRNSLSIQNAIEVDANIHSKEFGITNLLKNNGKNEYLPITDLGTYVSNLFEPDRSSGDYMLSLWTRDTGDANKTVNINVSVNADGAVSDMACKAVVEGWKLIECRIKLPTTVDGLQLKITPVSSLAPVYLDDIRMHPFKSHMKTYAYDNKSLRLMAESDENAFATFYEYDDEGQLVRVKKETERGIMTIKESHSSYRKKPINNNDCQ